MMQNSIGLDVNCCICGNTQHIEVDSTGYQKYMSGMRIQHALPKSHPFDRDVLLTRMCYSCLSKTYNMPAPGEDWGPIQFRCSCCDTPIYKKDIKDEKEVICPQCGCPMDEDC